MIGKEKVKKGSKVLYYKSLCHLLDPQKLSLNPYENAKIKKWMTEKIPGNRQSAVHLTITGEVTGVGYRNWLTRRAAVKGISCRAVNKNQTTVEATLIGPAKELEDVIRSSWRGPKRASVYKVKEKWFNRPIKINLENNRRSENDEVPWSQETANIITKTIKRLNFLMEKPNHYPSNEQVSGTDELAKECEKRGLFHIKSLQKQLYVAGPKHDTGFERPQTTNVSSVIHSLVDQKHLTKKLLRQAELPIAEGQIFTELEDAQEYLKNSPHALVVKPAVGLNGSGVSVDIRTPEALNAAWDYAKKFHHEIVIEELVVGVDIRILVIGGKGKAAYIRVPANITGDGKSTVEELIDGKNAMRLSHPHLRKSLIIPDAYTVSFLNRQGYEMNSIPPKGEIIFLQLKANISKGGDSVNITEYLHPDLYTLAEEAVAVFQLKDYCGIDLLVEAIDKPRTQQKCTIIELNSTANLEGVQHPMYGTPFYAANALMDHVFRKPKEMPPYQEVSKKILITGHLKPSFMEWVTQEARKRKLKGRIQPRSKAFEVYATGPENQVLSLFDQIYHLKSNTYGIVDGIFLQETDTISRKAFYMQVAFENSVKTPFLLQEKHDKKPTMSKLKTQALLENTFSEEVTAEKDIRIFQQKWEEKGYVAKHLYKEVFRIQQQNQEGMTGMHYSTYFWDILCDRWYPAKRILALKGFPLARGVRFKNTEYARALQYVKNLKKSWVATQLIVGDFQKKFMTSPNQLKKFWDQSVKNGANYILIEEDVRGWKICIPVVAAKAAYALAITRTDIIGDGKNTIETLIHNKNQQRLQNPWYQNQPIAIGQEIQNRIQQAGYALQDILRANTQIALESKVDLSLGGETHNVSKDIHPGFYQQAEAVIQAMPGVDLAYVYLTAPRPDYPPEEQKWTIDKIETTPSVSMFHFPWKGEPVDLAEEIIEHLALKKCIWLQQKEEKK